MDLTDITVPQCAVPEFYSVFRLTQLETCRPKENFMGVNLILCKYM